MRQEFHYPSRVRNTYLVGMIAGSVFCLISGLMVLFIDSFLVLSFICFALFIFLLTGYYDFRIMLSPVTIDEDGIWNSFRGAKRNYCQWADLGRVINRPDWSIFLEGNTDLWILFAKSQGNKTKLRFDNNIEGYTELARLVTEQVVRRGIKIEGR